MRAPLTTLAVFGLLSTLPTTAQEMTDKDWHAAGKTAIAQRLNAPNFPDKAKNVIIFIGDGMGVSTITAGRIFDGQSRGESGEENSLSFENFPHVALSKTYNTDAQVPDSAGTATSILTGVKTRIGVLGIAPQHPSSQCKGSGDYHLPTLFEQAESAGFTTGIVTTTRLTHATPGATYAHSASRNWEDDSALSDEARSIGCADIASQFIAFNHGDGIDVAFGGGRRHFMPNTMSDPENPDRNGRRQDGRNLIEEWQKTNPEGQYVWNEKGFSALDPEKTRKALGLFNPSHMAYEADRGQDKGGEPSLADMTQKALSILKKGKKGFALLVEGGRIDHAHHGGNAHRALKDTQAFSKAVQTALDAVDLNETLIIVTADHSHVFTMAGYPKRGNPILGLVHSPADKDTAVKANDGKPYTTLGYHNGPGAFNGERPDVDHDAVTDPNYRQQAAVPLGSETHGGEDVAVFATGAGSALVSGVMEQNVLYHIMRHALREQLGE